MSSLPVGAARAPATSRTRALAFACLSVVALGVHAAWLASAQGTACIDDAYISFQYARNLVDGHGLVFNPGERVEGYTNFSWVLLLSALHALGSDLELLSRVAAFGCAALTVGVASAWGARRYAPSLGLLIGVALALDGSFARWAQDGLETSCFTMLVTLGALRRVDELDGRRTGVASGVASSTLFALAALTRPEGYLWFALSWCFGWLRPGSLRSRLARASVEAAVFVLPAAAHVGWRLSYYGVPLPNTFYAKVGATTAQLERGMAYTGTFWGAHRPALVLGVGAAALAALRVRWTRSDAYLATCVAAFLGYVTAVGGDWMGPGRFFVPILPLTLVVFGARVARRTLAGAEGSGRARSVFLVCAALVALASGATSHHAEAHSIAVERPLLESRRTLGEFLGREADADARILTNEIGAIAWFSERYTMDLYGLIDPHIARMEVETLGEGLPGHEKVDFDYSLAQRPTIIAIAGVTSAYMRGQADPRLADFTPADTGVDVPHQAYRFVLVRAR